MLDGLTLVISPLIALMQDQVDALVAKGIRAAFVNSSLDADERRARLAAAVRGELDLLYVTPERFRSADSSKSCRSCASVVSRSTKLTASASGARLSTRLFAPGRIRARIGDPPTIALTATATPRVAGDIVRMLGLREPLIVRTGIERPGIVPRGDARRSRRGKNCRCRRARARDRRAGDRLFDLIRDLETLHAELARLGIHSLVYHGKLSPQERRSMQARFLASEREVVLATNAFGMGIDKPTSVRAPRASAAHARAVDPRGRPRRARRRVVVVRGVLFRRGLASNRLRRVGQSVARVFVHTYETLRGWASASRARNSTTCAHELLIKNRADTASRFV